MKRIGLVATLLLLPLAAAIADAQTVTLRYRWTKGEAQTYRVALRSESAITGMPGAGSMATAQTMTQVLKIVAEDVAPDGTVTARQTFQSVRMEITGPKGTLVIDPATADTTRDPMARAMRPVLAAMVGESVLIVMAPDGAVRRVDGASRIADKITQVVSADPAGAAAGRAVKSMLSDEALKATLEQSFSRLPPGPVAPGDTWTGQLAMANEAIGRIVGASTFTLRAIEGTGEAQVARIAVGLTLKQAVVGPPSGPAGIVMTLGDSKGEGAIVFDVSRGHIRRSTMRTELPSTVRMHGPDGTPATMQNKTITTMTMELVER